MASVGTFFARHWKGAALALCLFGVLTSNFFVKSQSTKQTIVFPAKPARGFAYPEESEPLTPPPPAPGTADSKARFFASDRPILRPAEPTQVVAPPVQPEWVRKTAKAQPTQFPEIAAPLASGPRNIEPTKTPDYPPVDPDAEREFREIVAEQRFLLTIRHTEEPPTLALKPRDTKHVWGHEEASEPSSGKPVRESAAKKLADPLPERPAMPIEMPADPAFDVAMRPIKRPAEFERITTVAAPEKKDIIPARALVQPQEPPTLPAPSPLPSVMPSLTPVPSGGCAHCARRGGLPPGDFSFGSRCSSCGQGTCVPGRSQGYPCDSNSVIGGFFCDLYACICCPDPCYEPRWIPQADAAFFVDPARPMSYMKFGLDGGRNFILPDRSEYFWARADGSGRGPKTAPALGERRLRYNDLVIYTETAVGGFSTIVNFPYRSMTPDAAAHASGFIDLTIGTKSLIFDCELLHVSFQFLTYIPTGNSSKGLGTGHVSLEPSILFSLKLAHDTYLQGQVSEWIPLGGDPDYQGSIFHTHMSINHVLHRIMPDVPIIGTFEMNTWSFQDGAYTDPVAGAFQRSSGETYVSIGPGLRVSVCDRIDFGTAAAFAVTERHFSKTQVRVAFRYRF